MATRSPDELIVGEMRRQIDHQITGATSMDTKAAGLIAATFALVALVVPRVQIATCAQVIASAGTFGLALATLILLALTIRPRVGGFSYGPDGNVMLSFLDKHAEMLERRMAESLVEVRNNNEASIRSKADALNAAIVTLIATVTGLALMLAVGAIE